MAAFLEDGTREVYRARGARKDDQGSAGERVHPKTSFQRDSLVRNRRDKLIEPSSGRRWTLDRVQRFYPVKLIAI